MTLNEFEQQTYSQKLSTLTMASCVGGREENGQIVLLYQLYGFYVEVFYNKKLHFISNINGFTDTALLDPYLEKITIPL